MKKIIGFFVMIWTWIVSLFTPKPKIEEKPEPKIPTAPVYHPAEDIGRRSHRSHNNRKLTKGRHVQYVKFGTETKPIYHGAK